ncbi:MAG: deoxyribose-phosphate aldolase [Bacteroidales bacterium]|jgi:deoxyribose-phosphate aldolase
MDLIKEYREKYGAGDDDHYIATETKDILGSIPEEFSTPSHLKKIFSLLDLTTLNPEDNDETAHRFTLALNGFQASFPDMPQVAALCIYPLLVEEVRKGLAAPGVRIAAVGAGFPSSQTFLAVKLAECGMLVKKGADEIDVVISVGRFLAGDHLAVLNELILIREATAGVRLKVILETGLLKTSANIRLAGLIAMEAGADFIKTSTGKIPVAATPEAVYTMAVTIRDYFALTGRAVGIKPAGGIAEVGDAISYYALIHKLLGGEWLVPERFRIGASRLANNLLSVISGQEVRYF